MIILVGPSASGKTEIGKVLNKYGFKKLVTYTTRDKRINEIEGIDYHFINKDRFKNLIDENFFFEYVLYNDNYYGTSNESIRNDVYIILEPNGLLKYKNREDTVSFYIEVDEQTLKTRMINRKDKAEDIVKRLTGDKFVFTNEVKESCDYVLDGTKSLEELANFIVLKVKEHGLH